MKICACLHLGQPVSVGMLSYICDCIPADVTLETNEDQIAVTVMCYSDYDKVLLGLCKAARMTGAVLTIGDVE